MTTFKTEINLLIDKTIKNITVALFDYQYFSKMSQEEIDTYLHPDSARKANILERCISEVKTNQEHFAVLKTMLETYGDNQPTDDLTGSIQEALDRARREQADIESAREASEGQDVRIGASDGGADDGGEADGTSARGHTTQRDTSGGAPEDDEGAPEKRDDGIDGNTVPIRRVGVE